MEQEFPEVKVIRLSQAAFLRLLGFRLIGLEKTSRPRQRLFVFSAEVPASVAAYYADVQELLRDFEYNQVQVPFQPNPYFNDIQTLKSMVANDWLPGE